MTWRVFLITWAQPGMLSMSPLNSCPMTDWNGIHDCNSYQGSDVVGTLHIAVLDGFINNASTVLLWKDEDDVGCCCHFSPCQNVPPAFVVCQPSWFDRLSFEGSDILGLIHLCRFLRSMASPVTWCSAYFLFYSTSSCSTDLLVKEL